MNLLTTNWPCLLTSSPDQQRGGAGGLLPDAPPPQHLLWGRHPRLPPLPSLPPPQGEGGKNGCQRHRAGDILWCYVRLQLKAFLVKKRVRFFFNPVIFYDAFSEKNWAGDILWCYVRLQLKTKLNNYLIILNKIWKFFFFILGFFNDALNKRNWAGDILWRCVRLQLKFFFLLKLKFFVKLHLNFLSNSNWSFCQTQLEVFAGLNKLKFLIVGTFFNPVIFFMMLRVKETEQEIFCLVSDFHDVIFIGNDILFPIEGLSKLLPTEGVLLLYFFPFFSFVIIIQ